MQTARDWKVRKKAQSLGKRMLKTINGPINLNGQPANFTWGIRFTTPEETAVLRKMLANDYEHQVEEAICETQGVIHDYWRHDLLAEEAERDISSIWAEFGKRGLHDGKAMGVKE